MVAKAILAFGPLHRAFAPYISLGSLLSECLCTGLLTQSFYIIGSYSAILGSAIDRTIPLLGCGNMGGLPHPVHKDQLLTLCVTVPAE